MSVLRHRDLRTVCLCSAAIATLAGCASNLNLSESIIFANRYQSDFSRTRLISGSSISSEYRPEAGDYGAKQHPEAEGRGVTYMEWNSGLGWGIGLANQSYAVALSAQLFRISADATFLTVRPLYLTTNVTTTGSYGIHLNARVSESIALGPFYRRDHHSPVPKGLFLTDAVPTREWAFYSNTIGVKGYYHQSSGSFHEHLFYIGVGYQPDMNSIMLVFGVTGIWQFLR